MKHYLSAFVLAAACCAVAEEGSETLADGILLCGED